MEELCEGGHCSDFLDGYRCCYCLVEHKENCATVLDEDATRCDCQALEGEQ